MQTLTRLFLAAAVITAAAPASALSLREAAQLALRNDPRMHASASAIDASAAQVDQARTGYYPSILLQADGGRSDLQTDARFPTSGPRWPNDASVAISQPIYSGGATGALTEAANATLAATRQSQRDTGGKVILAAVTAYLDVVRDRGVLQISQSSLDTLGKAQSDTAKRLGAGEATRTDVAQANARVAEAQANLRRSLAQLRISEAAFRRVTGVEPENLTESWPAPVVAPTLAEAIKRSALAPAVQTAQANASANRAQVEYAGTGNRPRLSLDGNAATSDSTEFGYDRLNTWSVLLKFSLPIYQGGLTRAKVAEASARAEQANAVADDTQRGYAEAAAREWETLEAADEVTRAYQAQVEAAQSALDGVRKELDVGSRTTLDLLNAEREVLAAQVNLLTSRRDRAVTAFRLLAACGELEPEAIP